MRGHGRGVGSMARAATRGAIEGWRTSRRGWPPQRSQAPERSIAVSVVSGEGLRALVKRVEGHARSILPGEGALALNRRQAEHLSEAAVAMTAAGIAPDPVLLAEEIRRARMAFD